MIERVVGEAFVVVVENIGSVDGTGAARDACRLVDDGIFHVFLTPPDFNGETLLSVIIEPFGDCV